MADPNSGDADSADADSADADSADADSADADSADADRLRRLAEIFGDVLPESTTDDRDDDRPGTPADERWYAENRPPHHDSP